MSGRNRELSDKEQNALHLIEYAEGTIAENRLSGSLQMPEDTLVMIRVKRIADPFKVRRIPGMRGGAKQYSVVFTLPELLKYVRYITAAAGLTQAIDGSVSTKDGITLVVNHLN